MEESLIDQCKRLRKDLDEYTARIRGLHQHNQLCQNSRMNESSGDGEDAAQNPPARADLWEASQNITLALRHFEDCRMRLGKVIQAMDGGVSCYKQ